MPAALLGPARYYCTLYMLACYTSLVIILERVKLRLQLFLHPK